jgi:hypothetical protein
MILVPLELDYSRLCFVVCVRGNCGIQSFVGIGEERLVSEFLRQKETLILGIADVQK